MVTPSLGVLEGSDRSDRAQLILVGAVAIAIIVLGLVVVFNTVLYTDNVAATGAVSEPGSAEQFSREVRVGAKGLTERVNANGHWGSDSEVDDAVSRNISDYSRGMANASILSQSAIVSFHDVTGSHEHGARIWYPESSDFESPHSVLDTKNWSVTGSSDGVIVRDFDMVVEKNDLGTDTQEEAFHIVWDAEGSSDNHVVWIYRVPNATGPDDVAIRTVNNTPSPYEDFGGTECVLPGSYSESRFTFNFSDGSIAGYEGCSKQLGPWGAGISNETARNVEFVRADNASGRFSMVVNDDTLLGGGVVPHSAGSQAPYWTPAVWEFDLFFKYESGAVTYSETVTLEVYNRSR